MFDLYETWKWLLNWVDHHPHLTGMMIFGIAFVESLVIVGILVPGAFLMICVGILISMGKLELWPAITWAIAGAIAGDQLSFWIGHHFKDRLHNIWPFSRSKSLLQRGQYFFEKHGGKGIVFGRFVGPVRAIIPTIAGMMGMTPTRFTVVNVISAIAWAPVYILPGLIVGAFSQVASEIAVRLVVALLVIIVLLLLAHWASRHLFAYLQSRTETIIVRILGWSGRHPRIEPFTRALLTPESVSYRALISSASILFVTIIMFVFLLSFGTTGMHESGINLTVNNFMRTLRTPVGDQIMVFITMLAEPAVYLPVLGVTMGWFAWRRHYPAIWHLVFAVGITVVMTFIFKNIIQSPRPDFLIPYSANSYSFPSAHATISLSVYGFVSVLIANGLGVHSRSIPYITSILLIISICFSRLYLGVHWLNDVIGGVVLGFIWLSLTGISYQRHLDVIYSARSLSLLVFVTMVAASTVHIKLNFNESLKLYQAGTSVIAINPERWWQKDWTMLPAWRLDLRHHKDQPLNIQFNGDPHALEQHLISKGWQKAVPFKASSMVHWLHSKPELKKLPVLPQVHRGRHEILQLVKRTNGKQFVLRLWESERELIKTRKRILIGNVSTQAIRQKLGFLSYPVTRGDFQTPMTILLPDLKGLTVKRVIRKIDQRVHKIVWNGQVFLIKSP